jgi:Bacterial membrane protein YfhO
LTAIWLARKSRITWIWVGMGAVALLLALGDSTPLGRLMFHVPVYNLFRAHARLLMVVAFAAAVLAGMGTAALLRAASAERVRAFLLAAIVAIGALLALVATIIVFADTHYWFAQRAGIAERPVLPWENEAVGVPLVILVIALVVLLVWVRRPAAWASALLLAVVVLDLGSFTWFNDWRQSPDASAYDSPPQLAAYEEELAGIGQRLVPLRGVSQPIELAPPCVSRLWGLPSASGCNPLMGKRYSSLTGMDSAGQVGSPLLEPDNAVLNILAVRYLMVPALPGGSPEMSALTADRSRWRHDQDLAFGAAYANQDAMPRVWLADEAITLAPDEVLDAVQHSTLPDGRRFDPATTALVEEPVTVVAQPASSSGSAKITHQADTSLELQVETDNPAFLVVSDAYYPGWKATVDGKSTEIYRTDYVLRGVEVPSGSHVVEFKYRPESFLLGGGVSIASILAIFVVLAWPLLGAAAAPIRRPFRSRADSKSGA